MPKVKVLKPEIDLVKSDEFYLFYEMMMQSLRTDNVKEGLNKSLSLLRTFLGSDNIALYKKNKDGLYVHKISDSNMQPLISSVSCIIRKTSPLIEEKEIFDLPLGLSDALDNMVMLNIKLEKSECILAIVNNRKDDLEPLFWDRLKDTMQVVLKRAASYERNIKAATTDLLTGLDNRNAYEVRIQNLDESQENLIVGIFDLFRLKYVNDNYTHKIGDIYIQEAAAILDKYWPKHKVIMNDDGTETFEDTGHSVYRVGGDEFVLLTDIERIDLARLKSSLAAAEAELINLEIDKKIPIGFNSGIVTHTPGAAYKETFMKADALMQDDKARMYTKHNLERRGR